jgi:hypothetical protein
MDSTATVNVSESEVNAPQAIAEKEKAKPSRRKPGKIPPSRVGKHMKAIAEEFRVGNIVGGVTICSQTILFLTHFVENVITEVLTYASRGAVPVMGAGGKPNSRAKFGVDHLLSADYSRSPYHVIIHAIVTRTNIKDTEFVPIPILRRRHTDQDDDLEDDEISGMFGTYIDHIIKDIKLENSKIGLPHTFVIDQKLKDKCSDLIIRLIYHMVGSAIHILRIVKGGKKVTKEHMHAVMYTMYTMAGIATVWEDINVFICEKMNTDYDGTKLVLSENSELALGLKTVEEAARKDEFTDSTDA